MTVDAHAPRLAVRRPPRSAAATVEASPAVPDATATPWPSRIEAGTSVSPCSENPDGEVP